MTDTYAPPAYQLYARDWLALRDTMPPEQLIAWQSLRCLAWLAPTRGEPPCSVPADDETLARMSGLGGKWRKMGPAIRSKFRRDGDRLIDDELLTYRAEILALHEKRSTAAKIGNEKRWGRRSQRESHSESQTDRNAIANGSQNDRSSSASASTDVLRTSAAAADAPPNADAAAPPSPAAPGVGRIPNWVAELGEDWKKHRRGKPPYGQIGAELKTLYGEHGAALRPAWERFLESPKAQFGVAFFARNLGDFLEPADRPAASPTARYNAGEATFRNAQKIFGDRS